MEMFHHKSDSILSLPQGTVQTVPHGFAKNAFWNAFREWEAFLRARILASIFLTVVVAAAVAADRWALTFQSCGAVVCVLCVVVGAVIANQILESSSDRLMTRTSQRPLATGRISRHTAVGMSVAGTAGGLIGLVAMGKHDLALLSLAIWLLYVAVYTPLKKITPWQTPVGAIVGAGPVIMGAAVVEQYSHPAVWILFAVIFFWQFPHAMAIAVLYRDQFAQAGIRVAPVADPSGRLTTLLTAVGILGLFVTIALGYMMNAIGLGAAAVLATAGAFLAKSSFQFLKSGGIRESRHLLRMTLVYLLVALLTFVFERLFS